MNLNCFEALNAIYSHQSVYVIGSVSYLRVKLLNEPSLISLTPGGFEMLRSVSKHVFWRLTVFSTVRTQIYWRKSTKLSDNFWIVLLTAPVFIYLTHLINLLFFLYQTFLELFECVIISILCIKILLLYYILKLKTIFVNITYNY